MSVQYAVHLGSGIVDSESDGGRQERADPYIWIQKDTECECIIIVVKYILMGQIADR